MNGIFVNFVFHVIHLSYLNLFKLTAFISHLELFYNVTDIKEQTYYLISAEAGQKN